MKRVTLQSTNGVLCSVGYRSEKSPDSVKQLQIKGSLEGMKDDSEPSPLYFYTTTTFLHSFYSPAFTSQSRCFSMSNTLSSMDLGVFHILPDVPCLEGSPNVFRVRLAKQSA